MGATSVTGKGPGEAMPNIKGPGNNRNVYVPLVGPHIVFAGNVSMTSASVTVNCPGNLGPAASYAVNATSDGSAVAVAVKTDISVSADLPVSFESFQLVGTNTDNVAFTVVTTGENA